MRRYKIFICTAMLSLLCGCFDYNELNMQALVSAAGTDYNGEETEVIIECESPQSGERGEIYSASGGNFFDAVRNAYRSADKKPYWGHARALVIGEDAARARCDEIFDAILRARDVYLDIYPVIVKNGKAKDIFDASEESGKSIGETISGAFSNAENSKRFSSIQLWELLREEEKTGISVIPAMEVYNGKTQFCGSAVLREGNLAGYLSPEQSLFLFLIRKNASGGYLPPIELSGGRSVSFEILSSRIKKKEKALYKGEFVFSPAEVRGDITEEEMKKSAKLYLEDGFLALFEYAEENGLGEICGFPSSGAVVEADVRISNALGGK